MDYIKKLRDMLFGSRLRKVLFWVLSPVWVPLLSATCVWIHNNILYPAPLFSQASILEGRSALLFDSSSSTQRLTIVTFAHDGEQRASIPNTSARALEPFRMNSYATAMTGSLLQDGTGAYVDYLRIPNGMADLVISGRRYEFPMKLDMAGMHKYDLERARTRVNSDPEISSDPNKENYIEMAAGDPVGISKFSNLIQFSPLEFGVIDPIVRNDRETWDPKFEHEVQISKLAILSNGTLAKESNLTIDDRDAAFFPSTVHRFKAHCFFDDHLSRREGCFLDYEPLPSGPEIIIHKGTDDEARVYEVSKNIVGLGICPGESYFLLFCVSYQRNAIKYEHKGIASTLFAYNEIAYNGPKKYLRLLGVSADQKLVYFSVMRNHPSLFQGEAAERNSVFDYGQYTYALELSTGKIALITDRTTDEVVYLR